MKTLLASAFFLIPIASFSQTAADPNGYAVVCNGYCTTTVQDENGTGASTVVLPQGYVSGRVDLPAGAAFPNTPGYEYKADPNDTLSVGVITTP